MFYLSLNLSYDHENLMRWILVQMNWLTDVRNFIFQQNNNMPAFLDNSRSKFISIAQYSRMEIDWLSYYH